MFLVYAVDAHGALVHIDLAPRGKTSDLFCPYCGGLLTGRKGQIKRHHFAHAGATCYAANREDEIVELPAYYHFGLSMLPIDWRAMQQYHDEHILPPRRHFERLTHLKMIHYNAEIQKYEMTARGKIPFGETPLPEFAAIQDELITAKHNELERRLQGDYLNDEERQLYTKDLWLYRAQLRRVHSATLYFLDIQHSGGTLCKVGVTTRSVPERIAEIVQDLRKHLDDVQITPLKTLANRGAVEFYFKHRYRAYNTPIGKLTEYFTFEDQQAVLEEMDALGDRTLSEFDQALLNDETLVTQG